MTGFAPGFKLVTVTDAKSCLCNALNNVYQDVPSEHLCRGSCAWCTCFRDRVGMVRDDAANNYVEVLAHSAIH